jgi:sortase (surface protein transpeptidase)
LDTPHNPHNVGWYNLPGYDKPGFGGNSVFSAHVDYYPDILGPFNKLSQVEVGDEIVVTMDVGRESSYHVILGKRSDVRSIPMGDIIWPPEKPEGVEWVTLITCGGEFRAYCEGCAGEYLHRDVVVAERALNQ